MEVVDTTQINSLLCHVIQADFVPPSEEAAFILSASQLSALISQAIEKAIQPLEDKIAQLRDDRAQDRAEFERFKATHRAFAVQTTKDLDALFEANLKPTATPQPSTKTTTKKTSDHIDEIALILANRERGLVQSAAPKHYLTKLRKEGMTFSQLASVMGLTVDRIRQLSRIAATDQRFNITWHPRKKNTKIIKLRKWDAPGL